MTIKASQPARSEAKWPRQAPGAARYRTTCPPSDDVGQMLGTLLHDASRLMRRRFVQRARAEKLPLNRSQAAALLALARWPGTSQAALAARLDIAPITLVRLLDGLEKARLIERRPHPTDRRKRTLWPTDTADAVLRHIRAIARAVEREALAGFDSDRRMELASALVHVRDNLMLATRRRRPHPAAAARFNPSRRRQQGHETAS
jgi:MarR family transcriptional regulator, transcriptional regulator for hemolysin